MSINFSSLTKHFKLLEKLNKAINQVQRSATALTSSKQASRLQKVAKANKATAKTVQQVQSSAAAVAANPVSAAVVPPAPAGSTTAASAAVAKPGLRKMLASGFNTLKTQVGEPVYKGFKIAYGKASDLSKKYGRKVADSWVGKTYAKMRAPFVKAPPQATAPTQTTAPPQTGQAPAAGAAKGEGSKEPGILGHLSAIGSAGIAIGKAGIAAAQETGKAFETIRSKTGATAANMSVLMQSFQTLGSKVPNDLQAVAGTIGVLHAKTNSTGDVLNKLAKAALNAARITGSDSTAAAEAAASAMDVWGVKAENGTALLDQFYAVSRAAGVGMNDLMANMGSQGDELKKMGFGFEQSMTLLANWQKQGLTPIEHALKKDLPIGGFGDIAKQIKEAATATDAAQIAMKYFGEAAGNDLVNALRNGQIESKGVMEAMQGSHGAIESYSQSVLSFSDRWDVLKNNMTLAMAPIGELILPMGEKLLALFNFLKTNSDILIPAFTAMGAVLFAVLAPSLWASAVAGLALVTPFLPLILILAAVGVAVGLVAYIINRKMDWIKEKISGIVELWNKAKTAFENFSLFGNDSSATVTVQGSGASAAGSGNPLKPAGSKYHGLDYVPYDGMIARLHRGERIMTARENEAYTQGSGTGMSVSITGNTFNVRQESDIDAVARALAREIKAAGGLMA